MFRVVRRGEVVNPGVRPRIRDAPRNTCVSNLNRQSVPPEDTVMNLFALLDLLFGCGKGYSPLTALLRSPYQVLRACLMSMKEKRTVLDAMAKWCGDNAHTVCGTVDDCKQQQTNVMSVIKGGYIMAIEVKTTGNVLVPLHRTPPVFSATTTLPIKRLQTCLSCFELNELICHLIIAFFYNLNLILSLIHI